MHGMTSFYEDLNLAKTLMNKIGFMMCKIGRCCIDRHSEN